MIERLTERARHALALAETEARAVGSARVETGALLVGLALEPGGAAAQILERHDIGAQRIRGELASAAGSAAGAAGRLPLAADSERVLERAETESLAVGHSYVGIEHILLALALVPAGEGHRVLRRFGLDAEDLRRGVERVGSGRPSRNGHDEARTVIAVWLRDLGAVPDIEVERLLKVAAAGAVDAGHYELTARDLVLALLHDERIGPIFAELGTDEPAVLAALDRQA